MYYAKSKTELITDNVILQAEDFGGWQVTNAGEAVCTVNGVRLDPAGSVVGLDFTHLAPDVIWAEPIKVVFEQASGELVPERKLILTRIRYTKI